MERTQSLDGQLGNPCVVAGFDRSGDLKEMTVLDGARCVVKQLDREKLLGGRRVGPMAQKATCSASLGTRRRACICWWVLEPDKKKEFASLLYIH